MTQLEYKKRIADRLLQNAPEANGSEKKEKWGQVQKCKLFLSQVHVQKSIISRPDPDSFLCQLAALKTKENLCIRKPGPEV